LNGGGAPGDVRFLDELADDRDGADLAPLHRQVKAMVQP